MFLIRRKAAGLPLRVFESTEGRVVQFMDAGVLLAYSMCDGVREAL